MSEPAVPALPRLRRSVVPVLLTLGLGLLLAAGIGLGVGATLRTPRAGAELFVYVSVVQLVAFGSAGLVVLCALTAAGVAARTAHSGGAVRSALRVLPALALVQASQAVLAVVLAVFWVQSSLAFAVLALLSLVVDRRGSDRTLSPRTRRLALLAVPFAPVAGLALSLVGAVVAAVDTAA
ncbi:MAG: hypothetical protein JWO60_1692, partial [Frankiales bacterium]|nr:hypothetical protein [Frankiales bacterium]